MRGSFFVEVPVRYHTVEKGRPGEYTFVMGPVLSGRAATPGAKLLGAYLKELRKRRDESLRAVASETGISNAYLSQLENNKRGKVPSVKILGALARHFDVQLDTLLFVSGLRQAPHDGATRKLTDRQRLQLLLRHPAFASVGLGVAELRWLSDEVVRTWMNFARALENHTGETGEGLEALVMAVQARVVEVEGEGNDEHEENHHADQA